MKIMAVMISPDATKLSVSHPALESTSVSSKYENPISIAVSIINNM